MSNLTPDEAAVLREAIEKEDAGEGDSFVFDNLGLVMSLEREGSLKTNHDGLNWTVAYRVTESGRVALREFEAKTA